MFPPAPESEGGKAESTGLLGATDNICLVDFYAGVFLIETTQYFHLTLSKTKDKMT